MNEYDIRRLALVLAIQAEVEGMKAKNAENVFSKEYTMEDFQKESRRIKKFSE